MFFFLSCIMFYVYSKIYVITNVIIQCLIYVCILFLSRNKYLNVKKCLYPAELKKLNAISFLCPNLFLQILLLEFLALKLIEQIRERMAIF